MKKSLKLTALATLLLSSSAYAGYDIEKKIGDVDTKFTVFGFAQLEMRGGEGSATGDNDSLSFHAQRLRLGWKYSAGKVRSKVFIDFNKDSSANKTTEVGGASGIGVPDNIKDAFVAYNFNNAFTPKLGVLKMPHGMSFTIPGWNLDVVERGFDKKLVLERGMGLMISGRDIGFGHYGKVNGYEMGHERPWKGFGYDLMIANQAGRSAAVNNAKEGNGNSYAIRGMFDWTELLHVEASYALSENAGGIAGQMVYKFDPISGTIPGTVLESDTEDYESFDFGIDSHFMDGANVKFEYITASNIKGIKGYDETAMTFMAQYAVNKYVEPTIKYLVGNASKDGKADTDLTNVYLGVNFFINPFNDKMDRNSKRKRNAHKVVLNYVIASGDERSWYGLGGYRSDAWMVQYQVGF
jgi:hypothetical protein